MIGFTVYPFALYIVRCVTCVLLLFWHVWCCRISGRELCLCYTIVFNPSMKGCPMTCLNPDRMYTWPFQGGTPIYHCILSVHVFLSFLCFIFEINTHNLFSFPSSFFLVFGWVRCICRVSCMTPSVLQVKRRSIAKIRSKFSVSLFSDTNCYVTVLEPVVSTRDLVPKQVITETSHVGCMD